MDEENRYKQFVLLYAEDFGKKKVRERGAYIDDGKPCVYVMYARKSTDEKGRQEKSLEDQIKECKRLAETSQLAVTNLNEPIEEKKSAKKSGNRPLFTEMIRTIRKGGEYNSILAWSPDRLSRNMKEAGEIIDLLDRKIIKDLKFAAYSFTNDYNGLMTLGFQFLMAKQYSDALSVSSKRGSVNLAKEGQSPTKRWEFGYRIDKNRHFRPDGDNFLLIKEAFQMAINGNSIDAIATFLNDHSFSRQSIPTKMTAQKVSKILANPIYSGVYTYGDLVVDLIEVDPKFIPAISYQDFCGLRQRLGSFKYFSKKQASEYLLREMVRCGYCGNLMTPNKPRSGGKSQYRYLVLTCTSDRCESHTFKPKLNNARGYVIINYASDTLKNGLTISKTTFNNVIKTGLGYERELLGNLQQELKAATNKINSLEMEVSKSREILSLTKASEDTKDLELKHLGQLRSEQKIQLDKKKEIEQKIKANPSLAPDNFFSYEDFSNFLKNLGETIKTSKNKALVDKILRMVFSNFIVKDKKVLSHQLNPYFEQYLKNDFVLSSRGEWT